MITTLGNEGNGPGLLGDIDIDDLYNFDLSDKYLYNEADIFSSLFEDRSFICNSTSSSACPSVTSETSIPDFDFSFDQTELDLFSLDRMVDLTPQETCKKNKPKLNRRLKKRKPALKNESPSKKRNIESVLGEQKIRISEKKCTRKSWSLLSPTERTTKLETLMEKASEKLGLREQLEIIKIINPKAKLAPSATEFFIDFELINDDNYQKVYDYVEQELKRLKEESETVSLNNKHSCNKKFDSTRAGACKDKSKGNEQTMNTKREKLTKMGQQLRKEKKSGLFSNEQVVAMASFSKPSEHDDDEEIDVLT